MNLTISLLEFREIDEKLSSIRRLAQYDPLISFIQERFQDEITHHLTSLKEKSENPKPASGIENRSYDEMKQVYLGIGKEKAVIRLLFDMSGQMLSTSNIQLLAEILLEETSYRETGEYIVNISGNRQGTPAAESIPNEMEKLVEWYNSSTKANNQHPIVLASSLHYRLTIIHPFKDWNGRIARLLLNLALMKNGYLPVLIGTDERLEYYEDLESADKGDLRPLIRFIARKEIETIDDFISSPSYLSILGKYELEKKFENLNKGEKCIVLTEDSATSNLLEILLRSSGFNMAETSVISYKGCSNIGSANLFSIFVKQKMPGVKILVHRDRDYLTDAEIDHQRESFGRIDTHLFVTKGTDIESYFLNSKHIHFCYPSIHEERARQLIQKALEEVFPKSVDYLWKKEFGRHKTEEHSHLSHAVEDLVRKNLYRFTHGKTALKVLTYLIQDEIGRKVSLEKTSPDLYIKELNQLAKTIWK
ncbi:MAG: Fic family protein [Mangrovibacterium sp.]